MSNYINNAGQLNKNVTLFNIIQLHDAIIADFDGLYQGGFGDIFDLDIANTQLFPVAFLSLESANYKTNELEYNFRLYIMDLVSTQVADTNQPQVSNENFVLSDTLQLVGDYISMLRYSHQTGLSNVDNYNGEYDFRLSDNVSCEPFTERFDSMVTGWAANFTITVSFNRGVCTGLI